MFNSTALSFLLYHCECVCTAYRFGHVLPFIHMHRIQTNEWCYNLFNWPLSIELVVKVEFAVEFAQRFTTIKSSYYWAFMLYCIVDEIVSLLLLLLLYCGAPATTKLTQTHTVIISDFMVKSLKGILEFRTFLRSITQNCRFANALSKIKTQNILMFPFSSLLLEWRACLRTNKHKTYAE